jgi:UPF0755 protein
MSPQEQESQLYLTKHESFLVRFLHSHMKSTTAVFLLIVLFSIFFTASGDFPEDRIVTINSGSSLTEIAFDLKDQKALKSPFLFQTFVILFGGEESMVAGDYYFPGKNNVVTMAKRMSDGDFQNAPLALIVPEGSTVLQIADIFEEYLPRFEKDKFIFQTKNKEGYLFPDTYFFFRSSRTEEVIESLESNFQEKIVGYEEQAAELGLTLDELITFASIVQKEANQEKSDQRTVAGIIWNRLNKGMLLQVDATLWYVLGKDSSRLTQADLKDESNLYNTYVYKGLPPGPIGNPGEDTIKAVLNPIDTNYFFYLHGPDGVAHYAVTHDGHVANKNAYLR